MRVTTFSEDFGQYLKSHRARLDPADLGLPKNRGRRTPGLRRQEVATIAGVSVDYYMRLEQGRVQNPSLSVVGSLAEALQMSMAESAHLHLLAGLPAPEKTPRANVRPQVISLLRKLQPTPAFVLSLARDILAWNSAMSAIVMIELSELLDDERNWVKLLFSHPVLQSHWVDWPRLADESVASLRADTARFPDHRALSDLVEEMCADSPGFAARWTEQRVLERPFGHTQVVHPGAGMVTLRYEILRLVEDQQDLVIFLPDNEYRILAREGEAGL